MCKEGIGREGSNGRRGLERDSGDRLKIEKEGKGRREIGRARMDKKGGGESIREGKRESKGMNTGGIGMKGAERNCK